MSVELRTSTRAVLPANVLALWDEIEKFAGLAIDVEEHPPHLRSESGLDPAALLATNVDAVILLPNGEALTAAAIFHELLHLKRLWVDGVPELDIKVEDPNRRAICGELQADLDHLVIIPEQIAAGFGETDRYTSGMRATWSKHPWPDSHPWRVRYTSLVHWLSKDLAPDPDLHAHMKNCLVSAGLYGEAEAFRRKALSLLDDTPRLMACACRFLKIPASDVQMRFIDIRARSFTVRPLPQH